jgi:hypothetical protein
MKRKSKKLKKATTSPKTTEQASTKEIKTENQPESKDLAQPDSIKQEEQEAIDIPSEEPKTCELTNSSVIKSDTKFLFIELKLISIDIKCVDYEKLEQRFLCVDSKASIEQIKKFIVKKMNILEDCFEVTYIIPKNIPLNYLTMLIYFISFKIAVMCNGFEVKSKCPLVFLKNRFFKDKVCLIYF